MTASLFYKAVRPDSTDFHTGTIIYATGKTVRPLPTDLPVKDRRLCGPGMLHAATVPTETLVGGSWPCRLFQVTGTVAYQDDNHPHKRGFKQLKVDAELPAWQVFGPQGEQVVALIDRCRTLTAGETRRLGAAWDAALGAARGAAWGATRDAAWDAARDAAWGAAWDAAWGAARDATLALIVRDLITAAQFDLLYGPWASVMEVSA